MRKLGMSPSRLKAFVLDLGDGPDLRQAQSFLEQLGLSLFIEPIEADPSSLDAAETIRLIEDYKPLDIESATMAIALCRGIRQRYPEWRHLIDGDGGDENLKDYPIEENPELTIRSVINNQMLYQEGWGVGKIKHSLTYSGGLSRSYIRTYAPAHFFGFSSFPVLTLDPMLSRSRRRYRFVDLTQYHIDRLYDLLKGDIVARARNRPYRATNAGFPKASLPARCHSSRYPSRPLAVSGGRVSQTVPLPLPMSSVLTSIYPTRSGDRDRWIMHRRPQRNSLDPSRPYAFSLEEESSATGEVVPVATVLLTNRECPWRCLMCDLWKNTLTGTVPDGAIPAQIEYALQHLPEARHIKLYNAGSFFDPHAIPLRDHRRISEQVSRFERVIVECHPALVGEDCFRFPARLLCELKLEVAMGLETAHPQILEKLNKRMTLQQFAAAAERLRRHNIALRVFILVKPPFMQEDQALEWANKSLDFAFDCGATAATLIPTRAGNGAIDHVADAGDFAPPQLSTLEASVEYGLSMNRGRVFADLWDISRLKACPSCHDDRIERLREMNLRQTAPDSVPCEQCEGGFVG